MSARIPFIESFGVHVSLVFRSFSENWTPLPLWSRRWQGFASCGWCRSCVQVWTARYASAMRSSLWIKPLCRLTAQLASASLPLDTWERQPASVKVDWYWDASYTHRQLEHSHIYCLLETPVLIGSMLAFRWQMSRVEQPVWEQPLSWGNGVCGRSKRDRVQLCLPRGQKGQMLW